MTGSAGAVEPTWEEDCRHWWGRVLTGKQAHWCLDWDFLPIDETCKEIECCTCNWNPVRSQEPS